MRDVDRPWVSSYDPWVEPDLSVPLVTYPDLLEEVFRDFGDRAAFHFMGTTWTFRQLDEGTRRFAGFLRSIGCEPGSVVGVNMPNMPQYLIAHIGALRAGCVITGVSPLLSSKEIAYQLSDSNARVLVTLDAIYEHRLAPVHEKVPNLSHVVVTSVGDFMPPLTRMLGKAFKKIPRGRVLPLPNKTTVWFKQTLTSCPPIDANAPRSMEDTALIYYTGGTTGPAKGAELTHENLTAALVQVANWSNLERGGELFCSGAPLFHIAGAVAGMTATHLASAQILIPDPRNTRHLADQIRRYRPTVLFNVPSLYQLLLEEPRFQALDREVLDHIKLCGSGAAPFTPEALRAFEAVVGEGKVIEIYGMTETTALLTCTPQNGKRKIGTVGVPGINTWVKIVDLETGTKEVPLGHEGEVIVRGSTVTKGYLNKPEETENALRPFQGHRWLYTGDVGKMDEEGFVSLVDRAKDMIIVGGFKVFSSEAEATLAAHPAVQRCAIVGVPNEERPGSELVKAFIQRADEFRSADTEELTQDIIRYCRENMAPYKVPKLFEFVDDLPLTPVGKVDKKMLRDAPKVV